MKKIVFKVLLISTFAFALGCSTTPKEAKQSDGEMARRYLVGVEVKSFSETGQWQVKSCPKTKSEKWSETNWQGLVKMANGCVVEARWEMVEELGNHLAQQESFAPWGAYFLSLSAQSRGDYSRALWMVELALKKSPQMGLLLYQKGRLHWSIKDYSEATALFSESLRRDPNIVDAHLMLGQIYYRDQEFAKARGHFERVLKSEDKNYVALVGLAECELKDNKIEVALDYFGRAVTRNPEDLSLRVRRAFVLETAAQNPQLALKAFNEIKNLTAKGKLKGDLNFDLNAKISELENTVSKLAMAAKETRKPGSTEEVAK